MEKYPQRKKTRPQYRMDDWITGKRPCEAIGLDDKGSDGKIMWPLMQDLISDWILNQLSYLKP